MLARELLELALIDCLARLEWVAADGRDGQLDRRPLLVPLRDQCRQTAAKAARAAQLGGHAPTTAELGVPTGPAPAGWRSMTSRASARYAWAPRDSGL